MHLGLDCGEQYFKAVIIDLDSGDTLHEVSLSYDEDFPYYNTTQGCLKGEKIGESYADPQMWVESMDSLMELLIDNGADLSSVRSISGVAEPSLIFLNERFSKIISDLNPNVPINDQLRTTYASLISPNKKDSSATKNAETIRSKFSRAKQIAQIIGSELNSSMGAPQIHQLYTSSKVSWEQTSLVHTTSSFLNSILIGESSPLELSDTSQLGLYDLSKSEWHQELMELTAPGLKEKLPQLTKSNKSSGNLSDYFTFKFGFSNDVVCFPWISKDAAAALEITHPFLSTPWEDS